MVQVIRICTDSDICTKLLGRFVNCKLSINPYLGGYSAEVPPLPIPNRVVKLSIADGTALRCGRVGSRHFQKLDIVRYRASLYMWRCYLLSFPSGSPRIYNPWGERSTSEYLLLKRSFGTYTRIVSATGSRHFESSKHLLGALFVSSPPLFVGFIVSIS